MLVTLHRGVQLVLIKAVRIGGNEYDIKCSKPHLGVKCSTSTKGLYDESYCRTWDLLVLVINSYIKIGDPKLT